MKKLLFISIVVFLVACDDTASSQDQYFANLPQEKYSSSSFENIEESSSSQAPVVSLSSGTVEESSSSEVSSSSQEAAQGSEKQIPKLDKLPFDTTGIQPNLLKYTIDPDTYTDEDRAKNGPYLGHNITVEEWSNPSCTVLHVYESGKIVTDFVGFHSFSNCVLVALEDSLMFSNAQNCRNIPVWGSCRNDEAYSKKIIVGNDIFYYSESEQQLQLTQVTDSTITIWLTKNPSYVVPDSVTATKTWKKSVFEGDTLVKFVGESRNPDYVDTIAIEKYNLTITDWGNTWIFANETCTTADYVKSATRTPEEQCEDWENYRNSFVDCTARNMNLPEGVYPRLCRPTKIDDRSVWCILDSEMPTASD